MLRLFEVNDSLELQLNKEWILMIKEFAEIVRRDRGSVGDAQGRRKLKAIKQLSYVFLMEDFLSPYREEDEYNRHVLAMKETELAEIDIDEKVLDARTKYKFLLESNAPSLKTLKTVKESREKLENYFKEIDLTRTNARGEPVFNTKTYMDSIKQLPSMEDSILEYENKVYAQLTDKGGIRGSATRGYNEGNSKRILKEAAADGNTITIEDNGPSFTNPMGEYGASTMEKIKNLKDGIS
jgi:hypothetical protein